MVGLTEIYVSILTVDNASTCPGYMRSICRLSSLIQEHGHCSLQPPGQIQAGTRCRNYALIC